MHGPNTLIYYCYRDAGNTKFWGEIVVSGQVSRKQLEKFLFDGEWFVPEQVGLNHLLTEPWTKLDHILHELHEFEDTERTDHFCLADELIAKFEAAHKKGWFDGY